MWRREWARLHDKLTKSLYDAGNLPDATPTVPDDGCTVNPQVRGSMARPGG